MLGLPEILNSSQLAKFNPVFVGGKSCHYYEILCFAVRPECDLNVVQNDTPFIMYYQKTYTCENVTYLTA